MASSVSTRIVELRRMSTAELRQRWRDVFGTAPGQCTKTEMWQALAQEIQKQAHGDKADVPIIREPRLPVPGNVITRMYKGHEIIVKVLDDGFEYRGRVYRSLTAIADEITGSHWSGYRFFGLPQRKRQWR